MAVTPEQIAFVTELFAGVGGISSRKMMGGLCVYSDGQIFATIESNDQIYLKAKGAFAEVLRAEGAIQFTITKKDGSQGTMGYWTLPDAALDDPDEACRWGRAALAAL